MTARAITATLKTFVKKVEDLKARIQVLRPDDDQWVHLEGMSLQLAEVTKGLCNEIRTQRGQRKQRAWEESETFRTQLAKARDNQLARAQLKNPPAFKRNITTIFRGPKPSTFDNDDKKSKKAQTTRRCEQIRRLTTDGIVSWAIAFPTTTWEGGSMSTDMFAVLINNVEPELPLSWPPVVLNTLQLLPNDEPYLNTCPAYQLLLNGKYFQRATKIILTYPELGSNDRRGPTKRRRVERDECEPPGPEMSSPTGLGGASPTDERRGTWKFITRCTSNSQGTGSYEIHVR